MVQQVTEGYLSVNERTFKRMRRPDLDKLTQELDKRLREIRGEAQPEDPTEIQKRNRRLQRLNSCLLQVRSYRTRRRL